MAQHTEYTWQSPEGKKVYAQAWLPEGAVRAALLLLHGLGEYSGRYVHLAEFFTKQGIAVFASDRMGHGKTEGQRGHIAKYEHCLDELDALLAQAQKTCPDIPYIAYGHSMGGGIVLNYALRRSTKAFAGFIATGSAIKLAFEPPKFLVLLGKLMRKIYPAFSQNNQLDATKLSRSKAVVDAYVKDGLVHDKLSSEMGIGLLDYAAYALEEAGNYPKSLPSLLMHGSEDAITSAQGSEAFAKKAGSLVECKIWPGLYHEIHNEPEQEQVFAYTLAWIEKLLEAN